MLYFAYGSNLLTARLRARCPSARAKDTGTLPGHHVAFAKRGRTDGSGKATVLPGGAGAWGVLYALSPEDWAVLDTVEGVGLGYRRHDVAVETGDGAVAAQTYQATAPEPGLRPFDWYLALIIAGCREYGARDDAARYAALPYAVDPDPARPGYREAVTALQAGGHSHWRALLDQDPAASKSSN
ncbi:MAG: gamma-glutamylcyclotransferase family protein [Pseudomonadota bacterium]